MDSIESRFAIIGEADPWGRVIHALWATFLDQVEDAWSSKGSVSFSHPNLLPQQARWSFSSFAPSPPEQSFLATPAREAADRSTIIWCVSVDKRLPEHGDSLGFYHFPFLGAGGSAEYTHACAPAPTLNQHLRTLDDSELLCLGGHAQIISTAPTILYNEDIRIMPEEEEETDWESSFHLSSDDNHTSSWPARSVTMNQSRTLSVKLKDFFQHTRHELERLRSRFIN